MSTIREQLRTLEVLPRSLAIWGLGQMGVAIKGPDALIVIDPCLSDVVREAAGDWWARAYPPPLQPGELSDADFFFASHEHLDHLDPLTLGPAARAAPEARFVAPDWCRKLLNDLGVADERIVVPPALEPLELGSMRVTAVPGAHYERECDEQLGYRWLGFLIEWNDVTVYHAGDTIIHPGYVEMLQSLPTPDVAIVPVNGRDWYRETEAGAVGNLLPAEAARLARDLGWDTLIPGHNDLYPNNAIPQSEIIAALEAIHPRQKVKQLQPGELLYYVK